MPAPEEHHGDNIRRFVDWESATAIVVGLLILYLLVPRMMANILMIPGHHIQESLQSRGDVSSEGYITLIASRMDALAWVDSGKIWGELGIAQSWYAHKTGFHRPSGRDALTNSITSLRQSLMLAPANTFAWTGLAYSYLARTGYSIQDITECLKISIMTAPYQPKLVFERLKLCLGIYSMFDEDGRDLIKSQIVVAAKINPGKLARIIGAGNYAEPEIENVLGSDSPEYGIYLSYKNRLNSKSGK